MDDSGVESKLVENGNEEKCGLSKKKSGKKQRKVQWNDRNGHKLTEVLEYQPSDVSDSEDEESDACLCIIM
ncbi:hypothetical protein CTI12_AA068360 [Artemisia annua]|uniref:Uncharacterized protein n=1 Tax=Artemisia annua TaxID=35608 RepID=A0A2U1Q6N5_ARTAN|nr:hypothetical protein CTI12_AA068360 [Artemisia annua]